MTVSNSMVLVTSYEHPDLDGTACSLAYAQLLQSQGVDAHAGVFGSLDAETQFVVKYWGIPNPPSGEPIMANDPDVTLVDASDRSSISPLIQSERVTQIIDHRTINESESFVNAQKQFELVGSCATLIAEKFHVANQKPSPHHAALLYSAIVSNTINFQARVTSDRDRTMAQWLQTLVNIPDGYVHEMFVAKSQINDSLESVLENECATYTFGTKTSSIMQLEIVDAEQFVTTHEAMIRATMQSLQSELKLDVLIFKCIDIERALNIFIVNDAYSRSVIEGVLGVPLDATGRLTTPGIIMRKELFPLVKDWVLAHQ